MFIVVEAFVVAIVVAIIVGATLAIIVAQTVPHAPIHSIIVNPVRVGCTYTELLARVSVQQDIMAVLDNALFAVLERTLLVESRNVRCAQQAHTKVQQGKVLVLNARLERQVLARNKQVRLRV